MMKCAQSVMKESKALLDKCKCAIKWDVETMVATISPKAVVEKCVEAAVLGYIIYAQKLGKGLTVDALMAALTVVRLAFAADGSAVGNDKLTCFGVKAPELVAKPNDPSNFYPFGVMNAGDGWASLMKHLGDMISTIEGMTSVTITILGKTYTLALEWVKCGDLSALNSIQGLCNCACNFPCLFCLIHRQNLGDFTLAPAPLRDAVLSDGLSHAVVGAPCGVCKVNVTQDMVDEAASAGKAQLETHRNTHFGAYAGRRSLFNFAGHLVCICLLHLFLRCIGALLKCTVFPLVIDETMAAKLIAFYSNKGILFRQVSESEAAKCDDAHRKNLFQHSFIGACQ